MNYTDGEQSYYDRGPPFSPPPPPPQQLEVLVRFLSFYWTPLVTIVGLLSNALCVVILSHSVAILSTWLLYVTGLVIVETLHLSTRLDRWAATLGLDLYGRVGGWCQLVTFLSDSAEFLALWYVVCLGADRVLYHLPTGRVTKVAASLTSARTVLVLLGTVAIIVYINTSITFGEIKYENAPTICQPLQMFEMVVFRLQITGAFVNSILPLFLLFAFELFLGLTLVLKKTPPAGHFRLPQSATASSSGAPPKSPHRPGTSSDSGGASSEETDAKRHLANAEGDRCSFVLLGLFLLTNIPVHLVNDVDTIRSLVAGRNLEPELTRYLVQRTLEELQAANEALTLPLLAATSQIFRQGLCRTMTGLWRRRTTTSGEQPSSIEFSV